MQRTSPQQIYLVLMNQVLIFIPLLIIVDSGITQIYDVPEWGNWGARLLAHDGDGTHGAQGDLEVLACASP